MSDFWPLMLILGAGVYLTRLAGIALIPADRLPIRLERCLRYLPVAILASLIAINLMPGPSTGYREYGATLVAACLTALVAWRFGQPLLALLAGAGALSIGRWLGVV